MLKVPHGTINANSLYFLECKMYANPDPHLTPVKWKWWRLRMIWHCVREHFCGIMKKKTQGLVKLMLRHGTKSFENFNCCCTTFWHNLTVILIVQRRSKFCFWKSNLLFQSDPTGSFQTLMHLYSFLNKNTTNRPTTKHSFIVGCCKFIVKLHHIEILFKHVHDNDVYCLKKYINLVASSPVCGPIFTICNVHLKQNLQMYYLNFLNLEYKILYSKMKTLTLNSNAQNT